jgi:toxin ParE1/3/4
MQVIWLPEAFDDLLGVHEYIKEHDPQAAAGIADRIRSAVAQLGEMTGIGRPGRVTGTRELVVSGTPYVVPYRVKNERVEILAVIHGAQKWPDRF